MTTAIEQISAQSLINKSDHSEPNLPLSRSSVTESSDRSNQAQAQLKTNHFKDLVEDRGLDARWIAFNCHSATAEEASQRLGYTAKSGGILLEGEGIQIQFKPDKPWKAEDEKKAAKYRSPLGDYDAMLPVHPDDPAYWTDLEALKTKCYQIDGHPCLVVDEGFFKALAGCSNDIPTIALLGVEMGLTSAKADIQNKRYLVPTLEKFARAEFGFIIPFDADAATNKAVLWAQVKLSEQLLKFKVPVYSATGLWSVEQGKGMDDYIQKNGADQFKREVLGKAQSHKEWLASVRGQLERNLDSNQPVARSRYLQRKNAIRGLWGNRLRFNTLKQRVELDGEPLDLDFVRSDLCEALDIDIPKEEAVEIVVSVSRENQYCPVVQYLLQVEAAHPDDSINLDSLASHLLNTTDPLHAAYLKRHLIGSVARAMKPGCKMDTALIFQGKQGIQKSTFFQTLYGDEFFDDTMAECSDKDELMKLHQHWVVEWAEFETTLGRRGYSRLKQFMSTRVDTYRPPYGRIAKSFPRHTALVGSTNEEEFLNDPSGDRRFWVLPVRQINIELVRQLRDRIWAAAVAAYRRGEQWWLTNAEKELADEANKPFRVSDTWEDFIQAYIQPRQFVTIAELLGNALEIEPAKQDKAAQMRAAAIVRRLGWHKDKQWHMGSWQRGWAAPDRSTDPPEPKVDREVDRCQELTEIKLSSHTDPPDPPFEQHLAENTSAHVEPSASAQEDWEEISEKSLETGGSGGSVVEVERCQDDDISTVLATDPPSDPPLDYGSYPHLTCDTIEAKRNQAQKIKQQLLEATSREELTAIEQQFSDRFHWVWKHLLNDAERGKLKAIAQTEQLTLFAVEQGREAITSAQSLEQTDSEVEYKDLIAKTDVELNRLNWSKQQGRDHLIKVYGVRSRHLLRNEQLRHFLHYLESQH